MKLLALAGAELKGARAIVIDVGPSRLPDGVGPMTIACLLENTVLAAEARRGALPLDPAGA